MFAMFALLVRAVRVRFFSAYPRWNRSDRASTTCSKPCHSTSSFPYTVAILRLIQARLTSCPFFFSMPRCMELYHCGVWFPPRHMREANESKRSMLSRLLTQSELKGVKKVMNVPERALQTFLHIQSIVPEKHSSWKVFQECL